MLARLSGDKYSTLIHIFVNYGRKKLYKIGPRYQRYKTVSFFFTDKEAK